MQINNVISFHLACTHSLSAHFISFLLALGLLYEVQIVPLHFCIAASTYTKSRATGRGVSVRSVSEIKL